MVFPTFVSTLHIQGASCLFCLSLEKLRRPLENFVADYRTALPLLISRPLLALPHSGSDVGGLQQLAGGLEITDKRAS